MRLRYRAALVAGLAAVAITCTEPGTGPNTHANVSGPIAIAPHFSPSAARALDQLRASGIEVTEIHIVLVPSEGATIDTVVAFPLSLDSIQIVISVPAGSTGRGYSALMELRNADHIVLFSGNQLVFALPYYLPPLPMVALEVAYSGPGKTVKTVTVARPDTSVAGSGTLGYSATAVDSSGNPVSNIIVGWTSSDPSIATVVYTSTTTATVTTLGKRGTAIITASTPLGISGSSRLSVAPPPARLVVVSGDAQTGVAGSALPQPLVIEARATDNLPVPGAQITFRAITSGGSVGQTTALIADANGRASTTLTLGKTGGTYQFEAASGGMPPISVSATATPAPPANIAVVSGGGQTDIAGRTLSQPLVVKVTDAFGGPSAGATVTWTKVSGGGLPSAGSTTTASDGTTSISYTLDTAPSSDVVSASLPGVSGSAGSVSFALTGTVGPAATINVLSGGAQTGAPNTVLATPLVVRVADANGNAVANQAVTFTSAGNGATFSPSSVATSATGLASTTVTLGSAAGPVAITASSGALSAGASMTIVPGAPATLTKTAGDLQTATVATAVSVPPSVLVKDAAANPVPGATVTFAIASGGGSATAISATTNAAGVATVGSWTLGNSAGANTLTASAGAVSATFSATGVAGNGTVLSLATAPSSSTPSGVALTTPPAIQLRDALGNPVSTAGVVVTASISSGAGALTSASATTSASGIATFTGLTISGSVGNFALTFASGGYSAVTSAPIAVSAGAPSVVTVSAGNNQSATVAAAVPVPPAVLVTDAWGNPVAGVPVAFSVVTTGAQIASGVTTGTSVTVTTNASGIAALSSWTLGGTAQAYTLTATAAGVVSTPLQFAATASPGNATQLAFTAAPAPTAANGAPLSPQPVLQLKDAQGNIVTTAGVVITASIVSGTGTVTNATATTSAGGVATFSGLAVTGPAGAVTIAFTAPGFASLASVNITISAGAATSMTVSAGSNQTAQVATAVAVPPAVRVTDASGNPVANVNVTFGVVTAGAQIASGSTTGTALSVLTNASGIAALTSWTLGNTAQQYALTASAAGLTGSPATFTATASAGSPSAFSVTGAPASITVGVASPPVTGQIVDAFGNPVAQAGVQVTAALTTQPGNVVTSAVLTTNAVGQIVFPGATFQGLVGTAVITLSAPGFVTYTSPTMQVVAGAAARLAFATPPAASASSGAALPTQPAVQLTDVGGNVVNGSGVTVLASVTTPGGTLSGTTSQATNGGGVATFTGLTLSGPPSSYVLQFTSAGLTSVSSTVTLSSGAAASLALSAGNNQTATVGTPVAVAPSVLVTDAVGTPVAGVPVTFSVVTAGSLVANGSAPAATAIVSSNASGIASLTSWTLGTVAQAYTMTATASGLVGSPVTFGATSVAAAGSALAFTVAPPTNGASGVALSPQPSVQLRDSFGNSVSTSGVVVTAAVATGPATLANAVATTTNGVAVFSGLTISGTGNVTLAFSAPNVATLSSSTIAIGAGSAFAIALNAGNNQSATSATAVAVPPSVKVTDASGNAVAGAVVTFTAVTAGGLVQGGTTSGTSVQVTSDAAGVAALTAFIVGPVAGPYTLTASTSPGLSGSPVTFTETSLAGAATHLAFTATPSSSGQSGMVLAAQPIVQLRDAANNIVSTSGVLVTATIASGTGTLANATATTDANGQAAFSGLAISGAAGNFTLTFTASAAGVAPLNASPIALGLGAATTIAVNAGNGQSTPVTNSVAIPPSVIVTDAAGNPVPGVVVTFTALTTGGILRSPATSGAAVSVTTNAFGVAALTSFTVGSVPGRYLFTADVPGLAASPVTFTETAVTGLATHMAFLTAPSSTARSDVALGTQPSVQLLDVGDNPVASAGVQVTVTSSNPDGSLSAASATTNASGIATFSNLKITGLVGAYPLQFNSAGLSALSGAVVQLTAGVQAALVIVTQPPSSATDGVTFPNTAAPVVVVQDAQGNSIAGVPVTASVASGNGVLAGTTQVTTTSAGATFAGLSLTGTIGTYTLAFSAGTSPVTSSPITLGVGSAASIAVNSGAGQQATVGEPVPIAPSVLVTDIGNNPVPGADVTFLTSPSGSIQSDVNCCNNLTVTTSASGIASLVSWSMGNNAQQYALTATLGNGASVAIAADAIALNGRFIELVQPPALTQLSGAALTPTAVVMLRTATGNFEFAGIPVTAFLTTANGTLLGTTTVTSTSRGQVTFSGLTINAPPGAVQLHFTSPGYAGAVITLTIR